MGLYTLDEFGRETACAAEPVRKGTQGPVSASQNLLDFVGLLECQLTDGPIREILSLIRHGTHATSEHILKDVAQCVGLL